MAKLKYPLKTDTMFKMMFVRHPELLKRLVVALLGVNFESIESLEVTNSEMSPEIVGGKFCRLDINMKIDGQQVNLEIQVRDEGDYPERTLFHWARLYSSALPSGEDYRKLPRTVVISIVDFHLFDCAGFHSEFRPLEATRHEPLTDKLSLHFFELRKLPSELDSGDPALLWLSLFGAETEEALEKIKALEVPVMEQAINAYSQIAADPAFAELARQREIALHNEASALRHARDQERNKWQGVILGMGAEMTRKDAEMTRKDAEIAGRDAEIERLRAELRAKS